MNGTNRIVGDETRQAIDALRGYGYQVYASAIAWLNLADDELLHLEVAEDFAISDDAQLTAVQSKATAASMTLNSKDIIATIDSFVLLAQGNPNRAVRIRFLTTSVIAKERLTEERINGEAGLDYWRKAAAAADVTPLRERLKSLSLKPETHSYLERMTDAQFRERFLRLITWETGQPNLEQLQDGLRRAIERVGEKRGISSSTIARCVPAIVQRVFDVCTSPIARSLTKADLDELISEYTTVRVPIDQHVQTQGILAAILSGQAVTNAGTITPAKSPFFALTAPKATGFAQRLAVKQSISRRLEINLACWLHAGTGFGKTTLARSAAVTAGGDWKAVNLRSVPAAQAAESLRQIADLLGERGIAGVVVDDIDHLDDGELSDALTVLVSSALENNTCLIFTSHTLPSESRLASVGLPPATAIRIGELSEADVSEVVDGLEGNAALWAKYVYLAAGQGHPQLVQAFARYLSSKSWPFDELRNLNALMGGNTELQRVRTETRAKLVSALPFPAIELLARLSLIGGKFDRETALLLGAHDPAIPLAAFVFDDLVGPWIDEAFDGVFQVSPLLSDLGLKSFSEDQRRACQRTLAIGLTSGRSLDAGKMNAAVLAALASGEHDSLMRIAIATLHLDEDYLARLSGAFFALNFLSTSKLIVPEDPYLSVLLRLSQFLLVSNSDADDQQVFAVWNCLIEETRQVPPSMYSELLELMILARSLISNKRRSRIPNVVTHLARVHRLATDSKYPTVRELAKVRKADDEADSLGVLFLMYMHDCESIVQALSAFREMDRQSPELRAQVFSVLDLKDFDAEMFLNAPWLKEHERGTINSELYAPMFAEISQLARSWSVAELAVTATKLEVVIVDEYGNDTDGALTRIRDAFSWAGEENWELRRAEAKVLFRAKRYEQAMTLYDSLISRDDPQGIASVEGAFMKREGGICAAKLGNWPRAAQYFEKARATAKSLEQSSMRAMATGLLGDQAIAKWQSGDRSGFITDYKAGLAELENLPFEGDLRGRHCHALYRHALLWIEKQLGKDVKLPNGEDPAMEAGMISNPDPSPLMESRSIPNIELAWYMLAAIELQCGLPTSIMDNIADHLPRGRTYMGEAILNQVALQYYLDEMNAQGFLQAAIRQAAVGGYVANRLSQPLEASLEVAEYIAPEQLIPPNSPQTHEIVELLALTFAINLLTSGAGSQIEDFFTQVTTSSHQFVSSAFGNAVSSGGMPKTFNGVFARKLVEFSRANETADPSVLAHLQFMILQISRVAPITKKAKQSLLEWSENAWRDCINDQGFLLKSPAMFGREFDKLKRDPSAPIASVARIVLLALDHVTANFDQTFRSFAAELSNQEL